MSYDLAVWHQEERISDKEAETIYIELCDNNTSKIHPHPSIDQFYAELTDKHPEIDDIPEEEIDNTDLCPWSIAFDRSPAHLIMCSVWSKAEYVADLILSLAQKHKLAVFDPQSTTIVYPKEPKPWWKLWE